MNTQAREIFRLIGEGHSLTAIAWRLDVSLGDVREACRAIHEELEEDGDGRTDQ